VVLTSLFANSSCKDSFRQKTFPLTNRIPSREAAVTEIVPMSRHCAGKCRISDVCRISLTSIPKNGNIERVKVLGEAAIAEFAKKHPASRKPLQRFVTIARTALWPHFPAVKETFPTTDYAPATGTLIFNIGGNKYRLIARVDFEEQLLAIQTVLTHQEIRPGGLVSMPTATYEELLIETLPQVIETEAQYRRIARRFGDLAGKGRARSAEETKLLRLLALLVEDYDRRHALPPDKSTPAESYSSSWSTPGKRQQTSSRFRTAQPCA